MDLDRELRGSMTMTGWIDGLDGLCSMNTRFHTLYCVAGRCLHFFPFFILVRSAIPGVFVSLLYVHTFPLGMEIILGYEKRGMRGISCMEVRSWIVKVPVGRGCWVLFWWKREGTTDIPGYAILGL